MTRWATVVAVGVTLLLTLGVVPAIAGERYCGLGTKRTAAGTATYVTQSMNRPGWRIIGYRRHWGFRTVYYVCNPR